MHETGGAAGWAPPPGGGAILGGRERIFDHLPYDALAAAYVAGRAVLRLSAASAVLIVAGLVVHW
ncbi:hypothetical protein, partial [Nocardia carnea]|uniref:hypothetical protein n=1 Tax=Nocardia carnea TaxID=37328 RepID=UPI002453C921